jgi:hypothetical protein
MSMNLTAQRSKTRPAFDRKRVFAAVEELNRRFDKYSKEERQAFAATARSLSVFAPTNEPVCRT